MGFSLFFGVMTEFLTTVSTDAHTARLRRALSGFVFDAASTLANAN
jgi:hypothetical protein